MKSTKQVPSAERDAILERRRTGRVRRQRHSGGRLGLLDLAQRDNANAIAVDAVRAAFGVGFTYSSFPSTSTTARATAPNSHDLTDENVTKFSGSLTYVDVPRKQQMIPSMSRPANPYDNASCESFMKTLKRRNLCK